MNRISPVERAIIVQQWRSTTTTAFIHCLIGENSHALVNQAGRVLFVILGAALAQGMRPDDPDIRVVRGAVNALHDQAGEPEIPESRRASIVSGLLACDRLRWQLDRKCINDAICDLALKLRGGDVRLEDFESIIHKEAHA